MDGLSNGITKKYNYEVKYILDYTNKKEQVEDVLSSVQLQTLAETIIKSFNLENVYCKIDSIEGDKNLITMNVGYYKDSTKAVKIANKINSFIPNTLEGSTNFIKQGYDYLKTLDEYKNVIDCYFTIGQNCEQN